MVQPGLSEWKVIWHQKGNPLVIYEITFSEMISNLADESIDLYKQWYLDIHTPLLNTHLHETEIQISLFMFTPVWPFNISNHSQAILRAGVCSWKSNK